MEKVKCPNCGSTAQVRHVFATLYECGCGRRFYAVCDNANKTEKKGG